MLIKEILESHKTKLRKYELNIEIKIYIYIYIYIL